MKHFTTGITFLRACALDKKLIGGADNDDILIQRIAALIKNAPPDVLAKIREDFTKAGDKLKEPAAVEGSILGTAGLTGIASGPAGGGNASPGT